MEQIARSPFTRVHSMNILRVELHIITFRSYLPNVCDVCNFLSIGYIA